MLLLSYKHHLHAWKKPIYKPLQVTLQDGKVTYYDLHVLSLKEFTIHCNYILTEKANKQKTKTCNKMP